MSFSCTVCKWEEEGVLWWLLETSTRSIRFVSSHSQHLMIYSIHNTYESRNLIWIAWCLCNSSNACQQCLPFQRSVTPFSMMFKIARCDCTDQPYALCIKLWSNLMLITPNWLPKELVLNLFMFPRMMKYCMHMFGQHWHELLVTTFRRLI